VSGSAAPVRTARRLANAVRYGYLAVATAAFLLPFYWLVKTSLQPDDVIYSKGLHLIPPTITFTHYEKALTEVELLGSVLNSLIAGVGTMLLTTVVALLGAYAITRYVFPGRRTAARVVLLTYMFPNTALIVPMHQMFASYGLLNNPAALVFLHSMLALPFAMWILQSYLESVPRELEEAALVEGATEFQAFRQVTIPQTMPAIVAVAILSFIISWGEYMFAFVLTSNSAKYTVPVKITQLLGGYQVDWGLLTAASVVVVLPVIALFWLMVKYLGEGIAKGTGAI
jgi:ABC-type glycerol-3-phosphate transport system permease component